MLKKSVEFLAGRVEFKHDKFFQRCSKHAFNRRLMPNGYGMYKSMLNKDACSHSVQPLAEHARTSPAKMMLLLPILGARPTSPPLQWNKEHKSTLETGPYHGVCMIKYSKPHCLTHETSSFPPPIKQIHHDGQEPQGGNFRACQPSSLPLPHHQRRFASQPSFLQWVSTTLDLAAAVGGRFVASNSQYHCWAL